MMQTLNMALESQLPTGLGNSVSCQCLRFHLLKAVSRFQRNIMALPDCHMRQCYLSPFYDCPDTVALIKKRK